MCWGILNWKQILEYCVGEIELYWNVYSNDEKDHFHIFKYSLCIKKYHLNGKKKIVWKKNC